MKDLAAWIVVAVSVAIGCKPQQAERDEPGTHWERGQGAVLRFQ